MRALAIPALLLAACATPLKPKPVQLEKPLTDFTTISDEHLVDLFTRHECSRGLGLKVDQEVVRRGARLEGLFFAMLDAGGPPKARIAAVEAAAALEFTRCRAILVPGGQFGLTEKDLEDAAEVTQEEHVEKSRNLLLWSYRNAAILGLQYVGTRRALAKLEPLLADGANPNHRAAKRAFREIRKRIG